MSFDILGDLTDEDIDSLGIYKVGDRIRLQRAIAELQPEVRLSYFIWVCYIFRNQKI